MKILILILLLVCTGCQTNKIEEENQEILGQENIIEAVKYVDTNSIKISLYKKINGKYIRQDNFESSFPAMKDLSLFSIILSDKEEETGGIKTLYNTYSVNYENFNNYNIGYNITFTLNDGTTFNENILKPKYFTTYSFSKYLYIWLYDDINNSGWYSHIEEEGYNENTVMTSIKLMVTDLGNKDIKDSIKLTVFTYDDDDFDDDGNYRGVSKFTTNIVKK